MSDIVSLLVNGAVFRGWLDVRIEASLGSLCRAASVTATRMPGEKDLTEGIAVGDEAEVRIGSDTVLTGYVTGKSTDYSADDISVSFAVQSKTVDLTECQFPDGKPHQWSKPVAVNGLISTLCGFYGVEAVFSQSNGSATFQADMDQTVGDCIVKILRDRSLLVCDDEQGRIVVAKAGAEASGTVLATGVNILSASRNESSSAVYENVIVLGQGTNPDSNVQNAHGFKATATNSGCRGRTKVVVESGNRKLSELNARAQNLMLNSIGNADRLTYELQGWRQQDGTLWKPNQLVTVRDSYFNIDQQLLVSKVTFSIGAAGTTTVLDLISPDAFLVTDLPDAEKPSATKSNSKASKAKASKGATSYTFLAKKNSGVIQ